MEAIAVVALFFSIVSLVYAVRTEEKVAAFIAHTRISTVKLTRDGAIRRGGGKVYTVQWCSHEGNLQERRFERLEDAKLEAADLDEQYVGVQIVDENGNVVVAYPA